MAADGRVYERTAIEEYFKSKKNHRVIQSPMTSMPLKNKDLLDATQHRNIIEAMLESGAITGELADKWNQKVQAKEDLRKKAEEGDPVSIATLLFNYMNGKNGFKKNLNEVHTLALRFHIAGCAAGTYYLALTFLYGQGTQRDAHQGTIYLALCAREYDFASLLLAREFAFGYNGVKKNRREAIHQLEHLTSGGCSLEHLSKETKAYAKRLLAKLKKESW
ncbi:MAG: hypothetical protein SGARI_006622 [Bacillariaceae sp.]